MGDRKLLELAAKAAGVESWTDIDGNLYTGDPERKWNPLFDDGDALRLAVRCGLEFSISHHLQTVSVGRIGPLINVGECNVSDFEAATRRAIVRAAAEIGRGL